mgnify:CR=1 FL=1
MRLAEQFIRDALFLSLKMINENDFSLAGKVWENTIKAIIAFAQEKSGKDVLALALGMASISTEGFQSKNYVSIIKETLRVADKIGIQDEEVRRLYREVEDKLKGLQ